MSAVLESPLTAATLRDLVALTKPRVTLLVLVTMLGGMWLSPGSMRLPLVLAMVLGTAMVVGAANALNCWLERDIDRYMVRTRNRPLPAGRLDPQLALGFGLALGALSVPVLAVLVNPLTALIGAGALASYVVVYTPLKQKSPLALPVGAIPGAVPPLMGWTAATGEVDAPAVVLFSILFLWQLPHFLSIALFRKHDYARAGFKVLPAVRGDRAAKVQAIFFAGALVPVSLLLVPLGVAGPVYLTIAAISGAAFFATSLFGLRRSAGPRWARRLFFVSLFYLSAIFAALLVDVL